jgi:hypothetical protein
MQGFIMSIIGALIKLLWIFSSASKQNKNNKVNTEDVIEVIEPKLDEKTAEIIEEVSKLDSFLTNVKEAKTADERLNLLIEYEEDEKMRELLIKMRGY